MAATEQPSLFAVDTPPRRRGRLRVALEADLNANGDAVLPAAGIASLRILADQIDGLDRDLRGRQPKPYDRLPLAQLQGQFDATYRDTFAGVVGGADPFAAALAEFRAAEARDSGDPSRPTDGAAGAFVAHLAGRPWLPWQRHAADVLGERLPNGSYAYPVAVVVVPRQCGKTTFVFDVALGRALELEDYRAAYTAQTGHVVTERFHDRFDELSRTILERRLTRRRSAGTERIASPATRSYVRAFPPLDGALRGSALDLVIVDEAQEVNDALGAALDRTILPTFTTRARRQLILIGTAGTDSSGYLRRYLDAARAGEPGFAVFEWGAHPEDDLEAESTWTACHPGLGVLTDLVTLRTARVAMGAAGFAREYLNVWTRTASHVVAPETWAAVQKADDLPAGRLCVSIDVDVDRTSAAIAIAAAGRHLELVELVDVDEAAARVLAIAEAANAPIAIASAGPVATVLDELRRNIPAAQPERRLVVLRAGDEAIAAAGLLDELTAGTVSIFPSLALDDAIAGATIRKVGDSFVWGKRTSSSSIAPLSALGVARWGFDHLPNEPARPVVHSA